MRARWCNVAILRILLLGVAYMSAARLLLVSHRDSLISPLDQPYNNWDIAHKYEGEGGMDHVKMLKISYADYSKRPACKQIDQTQVKVLQAPEGCNEYNIWYDRYLGEQWKQGKELIAAEFRCCVRRDSGKTKADERIGDAAFCCIFFARGACVNGPDCTFLHRIPKPEDDQRLSPLTDTFGRQRCSSSSPHPHPRLHVPRPGPRHPIACTLHAHCAVPRRFASDRDDMRGVGNFNRMNKTLYVGGVKMIRGSEATHKSLLRHFRREPAP